MAIIFIRPLSSRPSKVVCHLTRATIITASAACAAASMKTSIPSSVVPSETTSARLTMGQPMDCSVIPKCARTSACPSGVAAPWLPIAGKINGAIP